MSHDGWITKKDAQRLNVRYATGGRLTKEEFASLSLFGEANNVLRHFVVRHGDAAKTEDINQALFFMRFDEIMTRGEPREMDVARGILRRNGVI